MATIVTKTGETKTEERKLHPQTPQGSHAVEPSGPKGDNPATAGSGPTEVRSKTPENSQGHINPSSPEDANITPGSSAKK